MSCTESAVRVKAYSPRYDTIDAHTDTSHESSLECHPGARRHTRSVSAAQVPAAAPCPWGHPPGPARSRPAHRKTRNATELKYYTGSLRAGPDSTDARAAPRRGPGRAYTPDVKITLSVTSKILMYDDINHHRDRRHDVINLIDGPVSGRGCPVQVRSGDSTRVTCYDRIVTR